MKMVFDINQLKVGVHSLPFSRFPALSGVVNAVLVLVNNFLQMQGLLRMTISFDINQLVVNILPSSISTHLKKRACITR